MLRSALFATLDALGAPALVGAHGPRILLYHGVTKERGEGVFNYRQKFIDTDAFRAQLVWMKKAFEVLPLAEFLTRQATGTLSAGALAITFDDGYANNYTNAFPALKELGVPATFFITTDFIEGVPLPVDRIEYAVGVTRCGELTLPWADSGKRTFVLATREERIAADLAIRTHMKTLESHGAFLGALEECAGVHLAQVLAQSSYRPMTWEHMQEMEASGMTFAPHTRSHPILSHLPVEYAREEILASREALRANLTHPLLDTFAYPNGGASDYTDETIALLKELGFAAALTTEQRTVRRHNNPHRLPRFTMDGASDIHRARLAASGAYARLARLK